MMSCLPPEKNNYLEKGKGRWNRTGASDSWLKGLSTISSLSRRPKNWAFLWSIIRRVHSGACGGGDGDIIGIVSIGRALYAISNGKEGVESLDEGWVAIEQMRYPFDHTGGVDASKYGMDISKR